jgi:tRNA modification GTPase
MFVLFCRSDLATTADHNELLDDAELAVSSTTGDGMSQLRDALVNRLSVDPTGPSSVVGSTAARTSQALERTESRLVAAAEVEDELLVAVEIREALDQLGSVMGTVYTEDILDQVFSKFCIGK